MNKEIIYFDMLIGFTLSNFTGLQDLCQRVCPEHAEILIEEFILFLGAIIYPKKMRKMQQHVQDRISAANIRNIPAMLGVYNCMVNFNLRQLAEFTQYLPFAYYFTIYHEGGIHGQQRLATKSNFLYSIHYPMLSKKIIDTCL